MTHKPIALRFWVRVRRLSCKCGCSRLDVGRPPDFPPVTQQWYQSPVRRRVRLRQPVRLRKKQQRRYSVGPFAEKLATAIQASKSFRLKGEHDELMDSHLRGSVVVYKCELYVPHRIKQQMLNTL